VINRRLHWLLNQNGLNPTKLADKIMSSRAHVTEVLNNKKGRGTHTRKRLAAVLKDYKNGPEILKELGWDERGKIVPRGELQATSSVPTKPFFASDIAGANDLKVEAA
jgi:transcriptional regulator with XRE-family HTH domain